MSDTQITGAATSAAARNEVGVFLIEWMTMSAVRLSKIETGGSVTKENMLAFGHRFQVIRIATKAIPTLVMKFMSVRNRTNQKLIDNLVNSPEASFIGDVAIAF